MSGRAAQDVRRSRIWIGAPWTFTVPGTVVRVVNSISLTSEWVPVSLVIRVDFPLGEYSCRI